ncbi:MAG: sulfite exporter TauE/SafE family protein [Candidatus Paceibacterota bacterium]|jgi:hypothetical protein
MEKILIFIVLAALTFVNVIIPISGSATTTPLLAIITDPHNAIGLASFYFVLSGIVRIFVFRKHIQWKYIKSLLPISVLGAIFGALSLVEINTNVLLIIILLFLVYFVYKKIREIINKNIKEKKIHKLTFWIVGLFSGFLQGFGLAGSDLRNGYLYSEKLTIIDVQGTTAFIGTANFLIATIVRLFTNQVRLVDLSILIYLLPFIIIATYIGKKVLLKINKKYTNYLILVIMILMIVLLVLKMLGIKV